VKAAPAALPAVVADAGRLVAGQYVGAAVAAVTPLVAARWLGPVDFGSAGLAMAFPTLIYLLAAVKSGTVTTRYLAESREARRPDDAKAVCAVGCGLDIVSAVIAFAVVAASATWVARDLYQLPGLAWLMVAYAAGFPFAALGGTGLAVLTAWRRFGVVAALEVVQPVVMLGLVLVVLTAGFGVTGLVLATAFSQALSGGLVMVAASKTMRADGIDAWWRGSWSQVWPRWRELRPALGWSYVTTTMGAVFTQLPVVILGRVQGPEQAGYFRLGAGIATTAAQLEGALARVVYPVLAAQWQPAAREKVRLLVSRWTLRSGLPAGALVVAATLLLAVLLPVVLSVSYGGMIRGTQIMMLAGAVGVVVFWVNGLLFAAGRFDLVGKASLVYGTLLVALGWPVGAAWGFSGMAVLTTVGKVTATGWLVLQARRLLAPGRQTA
jgi:O-antigen/teichoic acid export membrane protein